MTEPKKPGDDTSDDSGPTKRDEDQPATDPDATPETSDADRESENAADDEDVARDDGDAAGTDSDEPDALRDRDRDGDGDAFEAVEPEWDTEEDEVSARPEADAAGDLATDADGGEPSAEGGVRGDTDEDDAAPPARDGLWDDATIDTHVADADRDDEADRDDAVARRTDEAAEPDAEPAAGPAETAAGDGGERSDPGEMPPPSQGKVVVERRGGVIPGFLGGVIAVIGAAFALPYVLPESMRPVMSLAPVETRIDEQAGELDAVVERLDEVAGDLETTPREADLAALGERLSAAQEETLARIDDVGARIDELAAAIDGVESRADDLAARLDTLERRPLEDSADPEVVSALEAYNREVQELRAEVEEQTAENARLIEEAARASEEARQAAEARARAAAEQEALAERREGLATIRSALEEGAPFAETLAAFEGMDVPDALAAVAEDGVPTLAQLQESFAAPARDALEAARRAESAEDPAERGLSFLQNQLGIRSLAPREGSGPDAVLSRAEAAARAGDLRTAVEELQALPEPARAAMDDWIERATRRADAVAAADELAASLATN